MTQPTPQTPALANTFTWKVQGMDCASCVAKIETAVGRLPGVSDIKASTMTETLSARLDETLTPAHEVERRMSALGYGVTRQHAPSAGETRQSYSWTVGGMDCASCAAKIETAVGKLPGVSDLRISTMTETLTATLDETRTTTEQVEKRVAGLGYTVARKPASAQVQSQASANCGGGGSCSSGSNHVHHHDNDHGSCAGHSHAHPPGAGAAPTALSSHGHDHAHENTGDKHWWQTAKGRLAVLTGVLLALAFLSQYVVPAASHWIYIGATAVGVLPVARRAFAAARAGMPFTIEMLMTIAAAGALVIGAAEEAALVVFLFAVGEVLEGVAANRARASIRALGELVPKTAMLEENGTAWEVAASTLVIGQTVLVRPGDRIPADGEILSGVSGIDESPVTGESVPKTKGVGESVFAGSINTEAAIRVRVEKAAQDNTIARIIRLVEEAQEARAPTERFIDRFSRYYMPAVVGLALLVALIPPLAFGGDWWTWTYRALALLLIGCPCALVISVPASIASALSAGARHGLLMKGGIVIEEAAKTGLVAFDKTGTLTEGRPFVTDIIAYEGSELDATMLAAAVETGSNHPLALAILERAKAGGLQVNAARDVKAIPGQGVVGTLDDRHIFLGAPRFAQQRASQVTARMVEDMERLEGEGKTVTALVVNDQLIGVLALRDEPREDAVTAVAELKKLGIRSMMLTGDNARTGAAIAGTLGMEYRAELMPEDKVTTLKALSNEQPVMMVGDGINDAPALAAATVGVAMGSGTDVALETADGALLRNRVNDVVALIRLSRGTMANIRQNIAIALGLKAVFLITSILGITGLWIAILADTGATVIVTANALRLLGFFRRDSGGSSSGGLRSTGELKPVTT
jgi:Cd2+/Zn2+-exporting ATPase